MEQTSRGSSSNSAVDGGGGIVVSKQRRATFQGIKIQNSFTFKQLMTKVMSKFGMRPNLPIGPGAVPGSLQSGMSMMSGPLSQSTMGSTMQLATPSLDNTSQMLHGHQSFASSSTTDLSTTQSRTEKVVSSFIQNALLKQEGGTELNDLVGSLRSENNMLQMVLKHQWIIEELREENEKLREILIQDLKVPPGKIEDSHSTDAGLLVPIVSNAVGNRGENKKTRIQNFAISCQMGSIE